MSEIENLDRYTVNRIYFRPRDEKGELIVRPKGNTDVVDEYSYFVHQRRIHTMLTNDQIHELWNAECAKSE